MKTVLLLATSVVLMAAGPQEIIRSGQAQQRPVYLYCKKETLLNEATAYVCDFGETENQGCIGWQHSRNDKKDVKEVVLAYKKCGNGKWLSRIEVK